MKRNSSYIAESAAENRFGEFLNSIFSEENVEKHAIFQGWNIDFYVKTIDSYVQFDGDYWHGLNRPIEEIKSSLSKRDKVILSTVERDKRQNETFLRMGIRLVRVTEKEFSAATKSGSFALIIEKLLKEKGI